MNDSAKKASGILDRVCRRLGHLSPMFRQFALCSVERAFPGAIAQVTAQVAIFCRTPRAGREIMEHLKLHHWKTFQVNYLIPLIQDGLLERTIPDKPTSRLQKYWLTEKGRAWLAGGESMTDIIPELGEFRPNPDWARLPLFDHKDWTRVQFGDVVQNMNLATDVGKLNLAGVLLFAERPELIKPQFIVKAIRYPGNDIHVSVYLDTEDFAGPLQKVFEGAMAFVMRNLRKVQAGQGVNAPGAPEIPTVVFEELLVNALAHRDYLISAPIRLFIFDNRIEIISPGHLPNNLTVAKIRAGNSNIRNPILVSYIAKGLLPYRGLGSGIKRALENWPDIDFADDRDGCLFTATIHRKAMEGSVKLGLDSGRGSEKSSEKILRLLKADPKLAAREIADRLGITQRAVEKQIAKLK